MKTGFFHSMCGCKIDLGTKHDLNFLKAFYSQYGPHIGEHS